MIAWFWHFKGNKTLPINVIEFMRFNMWANISLKLSVRYKKCSLSCTSSFLNFGICLYKFLSKKLMKMKFDQKHRFWHVPHTSSKVKNESKLVPSRNLGAVEFQELLLMELNCKVRFAWPLILSSSRPISDYDFSKLETYSSIVMVIPEEILTFL